MIEVKARKFYILESGCSIPLRAFYTFEDACSEMKINDTYHKVQVVTDELTTLHRDNEIMKAALEFYANLDTYGSDDVSNSTGNEQFDIVCFDSDRNLNKGKDYAGKRARLALEQVGKEIKI